MARQVFRILLDTNVWREVDDGACAQKLESVCRKRGLRILIAPSVVYEALRTRDRVRRRRLATLMTRPAWSTLMPEAYDEAEEFIGEVRRLRPHWLQVETNDRTRQENFKDWQRGGSGFWSRVRQDPDRVSQHIATLGEEDLARAPKQAEQLREMARSTGSTFERVDLAGLYSRFVAPRDGWDGGDVPTWRVDGLLWACNAFRDNPYAD